MANSAVEMFAQIVYSPELSYDDLHNREEALKEHTEALLAQFGGTFINFTPQGDTLQGHCVFTEPDSSLCHDLCESLSPFMDNMVEARLLFVQHNLACLHYYTLAGGAWKEACVNLPFAGPLTRALGVVSRL